MNKRGFSLVEILVSLVVASILVLAVGAISSISLSSHNKVQRRASIVNDITYAFKFIKVKVRGANSVRTAVSSAPWASRQLVIDDGNVNTPEEVVGFYNAPSSDIEFIYLSDISETNIEDNKLVIFKLSSNDTIDLLSTPWVEINPPIVSLTLTGEKDKVKFDLSTVIKKRVE